MDEDWATIEVSRRSANSYRLRAFRVLVDDREVGRVKNKGRTLLRVSAGKHVVRVKVDWCESLPIEADAAVGGVTRLICGPRRGLAGRWSGIFQPKQYLALGPAG